MFSEQTRSAWAIFSDKWNPDIATALNGASASAAMIDIQHPAHAPDSFWLLAMHHRCNLQHDHADSALL
jgi:hypothetical protein